jgi:hypothetical protein
MTQQVEKVSLVPQETPRIPATLTPPDMLSRAVESGASLDMIEKLMGLQERWLASRALQAFNNALADAKAQLPVILKNRHVRFENAKGDETSYWHEDLAQVVDTVTPILSQHGLSHRWRLRGKPGEPVTVTCVISHRDGHLEENELSAGADTSGGKNAIQGMKSAISYMERITLMASLGLASRRDDDDGRGTSAKPESYTPPAGSITEQQVDLLREALEAKGASVKAFLTWAKQKRIEDIPAEHYQSCVEAIANFKRG